MGHGETGQRTVTVTHVDKEGYLDKASDNAEKWVCSESLWEVKSAGSSPCLDVGDEKKGT